jgi:hypothetical protein
VTETSELLTPDYQRAAFRAGRFLRVVNWHNTPASRESELRAELQAYRREYVPVRPDHLDRFYDTGEWSLPRPGFVAAFYDGYANHATVAARVCDELGIPAWFFPLTGFVDVPAADQHAYATAHHIDLTGEAPEPPWAMTWDQLEALSARHVVAAHTASHAAAADLTTAEDVRREITEPIARLTEVTGRLPASFAFLWGTPPVAGTPAGDAVLASGIRYATTNTAYLRIAD